MNFNYLSVGAYVWEGTFHPFLFVITIIGGAAAHLFSNMVNNPRYFRNGTDLEAERTPDIVTTNTGFLSRGVLSERTFAALTWSLLAVAALCGALLSVYSGSEILWFVAAGALIAYFYVAPPLRFGYRGIGYSEAAIFAAFGLMPVLGSYFVQTGQFSMKPVLLSLPEQLHHCTGHYDREGSDGCRQRVGARADGYCRMVPDNSNYY
ncbi:prenyltransferase [Paenibacillus albidus]|nr:prenyltransferase [Paenibacillus albidus]